MGISSMSKKPEKWSEKLEKEFCNGITMTGKGNFNFGWVQSDFEFRKPAQGDPLSKALIIQGLIELFKVDPDASFAMVIRAVHINAFDTDAEVVERINDVIEEAKNINKKSLRELETPQL